MALPDDLVEYPSTPYAGQIFQADKHVYQYDGDKKTWRVLNPTWDYYATFASLDFGSSSYVDLKAVVASYAPDRLADRYGDVRNVPQRNISGNYTLKLVDSGQHLYRPDTDLGTVTWTVPNNSTVPFPIGATITIVNDGGSAGTAGNITFAPASGVTIRSLSGSTKVTTNRTILTGGICTLLKVSTNMWYLVGGIA